MELGKYASAIQGVRFFRRKELEPVATVWEYQVDSGFDASSARKVFTELPDGLEVTCFDNDEKNEETYAFIRRVGNRLIFRRGGHGWMSEPKEDTLERAVQILLGSPFVQKPDSRFESFRVTMERRSVGKQEGGSNEMAPPKFQIFSGGITKNSIIAGAFIMFGYGVWRLIVLKNGDRYSAVALLFGFTVIFVLSISDSIRHRRALLAWSQRQGERTQPPLKGD